MHTSNFFPDTMGIPGIIMKMTNQGDTIWSHLYKHPDNLTNNHIIRDIVELDDGDIVVMGNSRPLGKKAEVWLFKINSEGCFSDEECDEKLYSAIKEVEINKKQSITISPNPSKGLFNIESDRIKDIRAIKVFNNMGKHISLNNAKRSNSIDLSNQVKGIYHIWFYMDDGQVLLSRVIKI